MGLPTYRRLIPAHVAEPYLGRLSALGDLLQCPGQRTSGRVTGCGCNFMGIKPWHAWGRTVRPTDWAWVDRQ